MGIPGEGSGQQKQLSCADSECRSQRGWFSKTSRVLVTLLISGDSEEKPRRGRAIRPGVPAAASSGFSSTAPSHRRPCIMHLTGAVRATVRSASCFVPGRGQRGPRSLRALVCRYLPGCEHMEQSWPHSGPPGLLAPWSLGAPSQAEQR